jgi:RHS repeat-associated protein
MPEGRILNTSNGYVYEYHLKDHLGNTRVTFNATETGPELQQVNDYYPFGMRHEPIVPNNGDNTYLYNGKEFFEEMGLDWYDYGFRFYDPALGRFTCLDPKAQVFPFVSPYNYAENSPISNIDLWGLQKWSIHPTDPYSKMVQDRFDRGEISPEEYGKQQMKGAGMYAAGYGTGVLVFLAWDKMVTAVSSFFGNDNDAPETPQDKKVPNPNGKKGGPEHQQKTEEVVKDMQDRGLETETEKKVNTPDGEKSYRYVDAVGKDPETGEVVEQHQVGKENKNGTPVAREQRAKKDIEDATKTPVQFHPYNK